MSEGEGFNTRAVHAGEVRIPEFGNVVTPIFQTSTFRHPNSSEKPFIDRTSNQPFLYTRLGNPTVQALEEKYASLENSRYAVSFASGMAAITSTILSMRARGGRILSLNELYGQTYSFFSGSLPTYGYDVEFIGSDKLNSLDFDPAGYSLVYLESIINPTLKVTDITRIAGLCRENNVPVVVDATFASPYNQNPLDMGCTVSLHSATKYISGHSDVTLGIVGTSDESVYGGLTETRKNLGSSVDPLQAYLSMRGLKTLGLRMKRQNQVSLELAKFLHQHRKIRNVNHPGLPDSPYHGIASRNLRGYGGMLSFELHQGYEGAKKLLSGLTLPSVAASLGGIESLVSLPVETSHAGVPVSERKVMGISDGLIRFSCGIEDPEDLIRDIENALENV